MDQQGREWLDRLTFAAANYPGEVELADARGLHMDSARAKPGERNAYVTLRVPDSVVQALRGAPDKAPFDVLVVLVGRRAQERATSPIILPGEGRPR